MVHYFVIQGLYILADYKKRREGTSYVRGFLSSNQRRVKRLSRRIHLFVVLGNVFLCEDTDLDLLGMVASFVDSLAGGDLVAELGVDLHV